MWSVYHLYKVWPRPSQIHIPVQAHNIVWWKLPWVFLFLLRYDVGCTCIHLNNWCRIPSLSVHGECPDASGIVYATASNDVVHSLPTNSQSRHKQHPWDGYVRIYDRKNKRVFVEGNAQCRLSHPVKTSFQTHGHNGLLSFCLTQLYGISPAN